MIHILQLTDTHLFADPDGALYGVNTRDALLSVIAHAKQTVGPVDAVLLTGDLVHDESREGYLALKSIIDKLDLPSYYLPGNHDDPDTMSQVLNNCANDSLVTLRFDDWSVVLLDSSLRGKVEGELTEYSLKLLEDFLVANSDRHLMVALHHHIIDVQSAWLDALNLRNHSRLTALLENYPNVKAIVCGHVHQETDVESRGIRYLATPATCFQFAVRTDNGGTDDRPPAYRHIVLKDDGSIDTTVYYVADA